TYVAKILLGVSTDSFDLLGVPTLGKTSVPYTRDELLASFEQYLTAHLGGYMQSYPPYSSKTVDGAQLHAHARSGSDVELPEHEVELLEYRELSFENVPRENLLLRIGEICSL